MTITPLEQIAPGMTLFADVFDTDGQLLLVRGEELNPGHIALLKRRNIAVVPVVDSVAEAESHAALIERSESYQRPFFACVDGTHEAMAEIYRLSVLYTARKMAEGWVPPEDELPPPTGQKDLFLRGEGTVSDLVQNEVKLMTFPDIYFKIREVVDSASSTAEDIARVVSKDTSLSLKLLRLVNSPLYGFSARVESISRAVTLLGIMELSTLTLGVLVIRTFEDIPSRLMDMKEFWRHSISVGVFSDLLSEATGLRKRERFFSAGMLHDVGRLIMVKSLPRSFTEALLYSRANGIPLVEAEQDVFGFDHSQVGGELLRTWSIPPALESLVRFHHDPMNAPDPMAAAILHWADIIAIGLKHAHSGSVLVPPSEPDSWETLRLSPKCLAALVATAEQEIESIVSIFFS